MRPETSRDVHYRPSLAAKTMGVICVTSFGTRAKAGDVVSQGQPQRSHLSWQAGLRVEAEASAESERQAGAAGSAAPGPSGRAAKLGAACCPDVRGATAGAHRARSGRTSGGGGRVGAARGSRRRPRHRMARDRKPAGREPTSRPPAVPAPPPRRRQPRRWVCLTRAPRQDPDVKRQLALETCVVGPECHGSGQTPTLTSRNVSGSVLDNTCCRSW